LEATLENLLRGSNPPVIEMLAMPLEQIEQRATELTRKISQHNLETLTIETTASESAVGGGSAPASSLPTIVIAVSSERFPPNHIADNLRHWAPPIIARIVDDRVLIDLRTVAHDEEIEIEKALCAIASSQSV